MTSRRTTAAHEYQWGMTLADDVVEAAAGKDSAAGGQAGDILLGEKQPDPAGERLLLVRPLNAQGHDASLPRPSKRSTCPTGP